MHVIFLICGFELFLASAVVADDAPSAQEEVFRTVVRRHNDDGVHTYRVPALATTTKGTLIAAFDVRHQGPGDLPADIDVGMMRSTDRGETWSKMQVILDFDASEPESRGNGVGDPAVLVDRRNGTIFVAGLWSKGNRAWVGSGPGLAPEETGQLVLTRSDDDGLTWSKPLNITQKIEGRDPKWQLCFQGPGAGLQLKDGTLLFAAQFRDAQGVPHSCFIHSRNGGETWAISPPAIPSTPPTSEAQIAELEPGSLLITMRDESRSGKRAWARFHWDDDLARGKWSEPWSALPDPTCMASLVSHPKGMLLLSSPNSRRERKALTIRMSANGGRTWSDGQLLDPRACGYSCLTVLDDGSIGVLYECGDQSSIETLTFARLSPDWVLGK